jgi:uncharacterized protein
VSRPALLVTDLTLAVAHLSADAAVPEWATVGRFTSVTRTPYELSIVCDSDRVPADTTVVRDWSAFRIEGPLDFSLVGVLAGVTAALADSGVSCFALSTYDTDWILVQRGDLSRAIAAWRTHGYRVRDA